jgi:hypothetical protein
VFCQYNTTFGLQSYSGPTTYLSCQISKDLRSGDAWLSYRSFYGWASYSPRLTINPKFSAVSRSSFTLVPQVVSMSSKSGSTNGNIITLRLKGATTNLSAYACFVAGETCTVTQSSLEELAISIPQLSINNQEYGKVVSSNTSDNLYVTSGGVFYSKYQCGSLGINDATSSIRQ